MKKPMLGVMLLTLFTITFNTSAVQKDITITAKVDHLVNVTKADGSPLPGAYEMHYHPGDNKLVPIDEKVKIWTNAHKNLDVRLVNPVVLTNMDSTGSIRMKVSLGDKTLGTTNSVFVFEDVFPSGELEAGSKPLSLNISQHPDNSGINSGRYTGTIGLLVTQGVN